MGQILVTGDQTVVTQLGRSGGRLEAIRIDASGAEQDVVVQPEARNIVWAADAIAGPAPSATFGLSDSWFSWWWRYLTLGLAVVALGGIAFVLIRRWRVGRS